jgi:hypothetical protein
MSDQPTDHDSIQHGYRPDPAGETQALIDPR